MFKKENLIKMGLTDELAEKVANQAAEYMKGFIPKARFDEVNNLKNEYQKQIEELSKGTANAEELKQKLEETNATLQQKEQEYQEKIKTLQIDAALKLALADQVHDVDIVAGLIDRNKLEFDDKGNITKGLEDQVKTLKESKAFLFKQQEQQQEQQPQNPFGFQFPKIGAEPTTPPSPKGPANLNEAVAEAMFGGTQNK